jgi:hypothetical protein
MTPDAHARVNIDRLFVAAGLCVFGCPAPNFQEARVVATGIVSFRMAAVHAEYLSAMSTNSATNPTAAGSSE